MKNKNTKFKLILPILGIILFSYYLIPKQAFAVDQFIFSITDSNGQSEEMDTSGTNYTPFVTTATSVTFRVEAIDNIGSGQVLEKTSNTSIWSGTQAITNTGGAWTVSLPPGNYYFQADIGAAPGGNSAARRRFETVTVKPVMNATPSCSPTQISLNWTAVSGPNPATYYNVQRNDWSIPIQTSSTSMVDNGSSGVINNNTSYTYSVTAIQNGSPIPNMSATTSVTSNNCTTPATVNITNSTCPVGTTWNASTGNSGNIPGSFTFTPSSGGTPVSMSGSTPSGSGWLFDSASPPSQTAFQGGTYYFSMNCVQQSFPTCSAINFDPSPTASVPFNGSLTFSYSAQNCTKGTLNGGPWNNVSLSAAGYSPSGNTSNTGPLTNNPTNFTYTVCRTNNGVDQCDQKSSSVTVGIQNACYPIVPNPPGYNNACTSSPNVCGQTNPGNIQCNGSCSASAPAVPAGYGNACSSTTNACGQSNSGTIQCNGSCSATTPPDSSCPAGLPTVSTSAISGVTQNSATSGGTISSNGGATVTQSGIVWSTSANPTIANTKTTDGWAIGGPWSSNMTGLNSGTLYYVRAYATNSAGTAYGANVTFSTTSPASTSGTLTGPTSCTINVGLNSCNVNLAWSVSNPPPSSSNSITYWNGAIISYFLSGNSGTQSVVVPGGPSARVFHLSNSAIPDEIASPATVYGNCIAGSAWDGSNCVSGAVNGQCSATSYNCSTGTSANNVDGVSSWTWNCNGSNGGSSASCSQAKSGGYPDLVAGAVAIGSPIINTPQKFTALITNQGNASTGAPFHNFIQVSDGTQGSGSNLVDLTPDTSNALNPGENSTTTSPTFTFTDATKTYSVRACADKVNRYSVDSATSAYITESNSSGTGETNNCGPWTDVILNSQSSLPDLTASNPSPSTATTNVALTFTSTISNLGGTPTGSSFSNFFQTATAASGGGTVTDRSSSFMNALAAGGSATATSPSITFASAGTYSIRACADKTSSGGGGVITESDESNNCGSWTNVTVNNAVSVINGSCAATHYLCNAGTSVNNVNGASYTWNCNGINGGTNASCSEVKSGGGTTLTANPTTINPGDSSTLTWTSAATTCSGVNFNTNGTNNLANGSASVSPIVTTTYTINCNDSTTASATVKVNKKPGVIEN